ncbi:MAG: phenylalanine--tRNA ligase subunit beta [Candidatus Komeilibacteria bacterium]|nr:phenylalanine--tRNA ligase subunit beta [Candidatus Komeilibacteria bacterium]
MLLSLNFIKQYVKLPDVKPADVALALTMSTVEVESITDQAAHLEGIVVGRVLEIVKHPQADRLWICRVDVKSEELQVICGGSNLSKGMYVAVAKVGSKVRWHGKGEPIVLEAAKIRGVESHGMIASSNEIGLANLFPAGDDHEILDLSPYRVRVGDPLSKALGLSDTIFEIDNKSMTHRPDLWGQYGLARELAAIYDTKLKPMKSAPIPELEGPQLQLSLTVKDAKLCPRYAALILDNVIVGPSPWWLRRDLEAAGIHSVNVIVDCTNYVMLVLGQPLHAFDYQSVPHQAITVEPAGEKISFAALNGKTYELPPETLCIKDGAQTLAIAGIIGGTESLITDKTKTIVIESAHFNASAIRKTEMALGLRTEASSRFEKKLDPVLVPQALGMVVELIRQLAPGTQVASRVYEVDHRSPERPVIQIEKKFLDKRLGTELDSKEVVSILKRLSFEVGVKRGTYTVTVPSFRARDVVAPEDLVEEVARIHGYNAIPWALPTVTLAQPARMLASRVEREMKIALTGDFGYSEIYTYSFADMLWSDTLGFNRNRLTVANALTPEHQYLRSSLLPSLIARAVDNLRWYPSFKLFELGRVFSKQAGEFATDASNTSFLPSQPIMLAGVVVAPKQELETAYASVKGEATELLRILNIAVSFKESKQYGFASPCFEVRTQSGSVGFFGVVKPEIAGNDFKNKAVLWWELQFGELVKFADFSKTYEPLLKFPSIIRDISILVDTKTTWAAIDKSLQNVSPLVRSIELFDVYSFSKATKESMGSKKSVAFSITFVSDERTLASKEVDVVIDKIKKILADKFEAIVR